MQRRDRSVIATAFCAHRFIYCFFFGGIHRRPYDITSLYYVAPRSQRYKCEACTKTKCGFRQTTIQSSLLIVRKGDVTPKNSAKRFSRLTRSTPILDIESSNIKHYFHHLFYFLYYHYWYCYTYYCSFIIITKINIIVLIIMLTITKFFLIFVKIMIII